MLAPLAVFVFFLTLKHGEQWWRNIYTNNSWLRRGVGGSGWRIRGCSNKAEHTTERHQRWTANRLCRICFCWCVPSLHFGSEYELPTMVLAPSTLGWRLVQRMRASDPASFEHHIIRKYSSPPHLLVLLPASHFFLPVNVPC